MSSNSTPGPALKQAQARPRGGNPQFISLSELADQRFTFRDVLGLMPAMLVSLVFNGMIVACLLLFSSGGQADAKTQTVEIEEETRIEDRQDQEYNLVDFSAPSLDTKVSIQADDPGSLDSLNLPTATTPETTDQPAGSLTGSEDAADAGSGFQGISPNLTPGFLDASKLGSGLKGEGGGDSFLARQGKPGGVQARTAGNRRDIALREGASNESEEAVAKGLDWMARHQGMDGRWSLHVYHQHGRCNCRDAKVENQVENNDTAGTAFGLLPFLGAGETHLKKGGKYTRNVYTGLYFLIDKQNKSADPSKRGDLGGGMYAHGLAAIALCEAYAMTSDPKLKGPAQAAIDFIVYAQHPQTGGWRYGPRQEGDTSVVGWQVMALRSGQMAGLNVPLPTLEGAKKWLDSCAHTHAGSKLALYSYTPDSGATATMTAAGLLNRQYMGWGTRNPDLQAGVKYLMGTLPPAPGKKGPQREPLGQIYYYYYATQVMHHMGGDEWEKWNSHMRDFLVRTQEKSGHRMGSWDPAGADFGTRGGRLYSTSLAVLTLEVYYRHLPLYRRVIGKENDQMKK